MFVKCRPYVVERYGYYNANNANKTATIISTEIEYYYILAVVYFLN